MQRIQQAMAMRPRNPRCSPTVQTKGSRIEEAYFQLECRAETVQQWAQTKMNAQDMTVAEFFAGIGLMRIGLEKAGWHIAFANDIDHDKWQMYKDHFGDTGEFIVEDIQPHYIRPSNAQRAGNV
jgi:hypothetical protein